MRSKWIGSVLLLLLMCVRTLYAYPEQIIVYRGNPQRTGVIDAIPIRQLPNIAWEVDLEGSTNDSPLLVGNTLYVVTTPRRNTGVLVALDASTGAERWAVELGGALIGPMAYGNNILFLGTSNGGLSAIDAQSGDEVWRFSASGRVWSSPLILDDAVYISADRGVFRLDALTGTPLWQSRECRSPGGTAYADGKLYVVCSRGITALDITSGVPMWDMALPTIFALAVDNGAIYASGENSVYAINTQTQQILWQSESGMVWSSPVVSENLVYAGNMNGFVIAFDRVTGDVRWRFEAEDWATSDAILVGDVLYFGVGNHEQDIAERHFYALDAATGEQLWSVAAPEMLISAPVAVENTLYFVTVLSRVYALEDPTL
jgi:outer membrane protein assembly factor BamB